MPLWLGRKRDIADIPYPLRSTRCNTLQKVSEDVQSQKILVLVSVQQFFYSTTQLLLLSAASSSRKDGLLKRLILARDKPCGRYKFQRPARTKIRLQSIYSSSRSGCACISVVAHVCPPILCRSITVATIAAAASSVAICTFKFCRIVRTKKDI